MPLSESHLIQQALERVLLQSKLPWIEKAEAPLWNFVFVKPKDSESQIKIREAISAMASALTLTHWGLQDHETARKSAQIEICFGVPGQYSFPDLLEILSSPQEKKKVWARLKEIHASVASV